MRSSKSLLYGLDSLDPVARPLDEGRQHVPRLCGVRRHRRPALKTHRALPFSVLAWRRAAARRGDHMVDEAVVLRLLRGEPAVAVEVGGDCSTVWPVCWAISSAIPA